MIYNSSLSTISIQMILFTCPAKRKCLTFCFVSSSLWLTDWKCFSQVPYSDASKKPRIPAAGTKTWKKKDFYVIFWNKFWRMQKTRKNKVFLEILSSHYAIHAYMIWLFGGEKVFKFKSYRFLPILVQYPNFYTFFSSFVKRSSSTYFINLFRGVTPFPTKNTFGIL